MRKDVFSVDGSSDTIRTSDVYVRDASGNILAVYKGKSRLTGSYTIDWINTDIDQHGGLWITPSNQGLTPFLIAQFGNNGQFITPLIHTGQAINPSWSDEQSVSLSLNQFLTLSDPIYLQATQEPFSDYFGPMVTANTALVTATLIGDGSSGPFLGLFNGLLGDSKQLLPTLTHLTTDATDLTHAIMTNMSLPYSGDATRDANTLSAYVSGRGPSLLLNAYASNVTSYSVDHFYTGLVTDSKILNQTWFQGQPDVSFLLSDAVFNYAPRSDAASFFNDYLPTIDPDWLKNNTAADDRLNIVYQNDQVSFMNTYQNDVGISGVNTALNSIPQLTVSGYLHAVWEGVLHGTLNPSYTPPNTNSPNPGSQLIADTLYLAEHHLYGSSRLGIKTYDTSAHLRSVYVGLNAATSAPGYISDSTLNLTMSWLDGGFQDWIGKGKTSTYTSGTFNLSTDSIWEIRNLGAKQYELTDHLGNVLATVLDKKTGYGSVSGLYQGYYANLGGVTDYYPGGFEMPGRNKQYVPFRFGNQNQEKDNEIYGEGNAYAFKYRFEDTRLNRFFSVDPLSAKYPWNSSYAFGENRLTDGTELEGLEWQPINSMGENESIGSSTTTDYRWEGFNKDGSAPAGTLPGARVTLPGSNATYSSYFDPASKSGTGMFLMSSLNSSTSKSILIYSNNTASRENGEMLESPVNGQREFAYTNVLGMSGLVMSNQLTTSFGGVRSSTPKEGLEPVDDPFTSIGPGIVYGLGKRAILGLTQSSIELVVAENSGLKTFNSLTEKFGEGYQSVAVAQGKRLPVQLGQKLNALSPGTWSKIYEAGILDGAKVETHYFFNANTGQYVNPFIKSSTWGKVFRGVTSQ